MPPHRYEAYDTSRFTGTIGELLMRRGDIEANRAIQIANAQARAAEVRGQAWAGAVSNIGDIAGRTITTYAKEQREAPIRARQDEMDRLKLDEARSEAEVRKAIVAQDRAISSLFAGGRMPTPQELMQAAGPERGAKIAGGISAFQELQAKQVTNARDTAGRLAIGAKSLPADALARVWPGLRQAAITGGLGDEQSIPTEPAADYLDSIVGWATGKERPVEDPSKGDYTINGQRFHKDGTPIGPQVPPQATPAAAQTHNMRLQGVGDVPVDYVPNKDGTGGRWMYQGEDVTGKISAIPPASVQVLNNQQGNAPGDWNTTGEAFLESIPAQWRATVKKIANYDEDPSKVASMRGGIRERLMQWVNQVNPSYDSSVFGNRAPTRKAFTTGTQGKQINNINTAIGHIDQLMTLADQLQNGGFVPANKAWNSIRTTFGSDKVTNFDTLKDALAGEVAGVLSQSGATVSGIADAQAKIHASNSPAQLAGYVKTLIPVMGSKLSSLNYQYHQAMGEHDPFSALSPESRSILLKHGFNPEHPTMGGDADDAYAAYLKRQGGR